MHATERGVVHRDIKPSNIIVTPQGRAKLVDMGLARRFERGNDDGLTQSGMTLGTFDYISPEQARDPRDVDVRSDLYSLGCTLFHMLTGRPPFPDGTVLQKLIQHQEEPPPDVCALNPPVPPDLASILVKLMAKDRDRRYQTPEQLVRDLLTVAGTLGLRSVSPEGLVWMSATAPAAWERHLVWALPALAFALVMIALVWWGQDTGAPVPRTNPDVLPSLSDQAAVPKAEQRRSGRTDQVLPARDAMPQGGASEEAVVDRAGGSPRHRRRFERGPARGPGLGAAAVDRGARRRRAVPARWRVVGSAPACAIARPRPDHQGRCRRHAHAAAGPRCRWSAARPRGRCSTWCGGHVTLEGLEFVLDTGDREAALWPPSGPRTPS